MSVKAEKLEGSMVKLEITVAAEEFEKAIAGVYNRQKGSIAVRGFRKGKAPQAVIEKVYGEGVFYQDAANDLINKTYPEEAEQSGEEITSSPKISVVQLGHGKDFIYTAEVAVKPPVELGQYKELEVAKQDREVSDEDVQKEIDAERDKNAQSVEVTDRAVVKGDEIKLDFEGFVDGVAFDGGKGTDYPLTIGSGSFIPGFEDQLVGAEIGKEMEVNVTFPENYGSADLAGKAATFKCTVKSIREKKLPELDDEYVSEHTEFEKVDEYKADVKAKIADRKAKAAEEAKTNEAVDKAVANAKIDIPAPMIDTQVEQMIEEYGQRFQQQGISLDQYFQYTGTTREQMASQMRPMAVKRIESRLVLEEIVKAENITASEEDVEKQLQAMADAYKMEISKLKELINDKYMDTIRKDIAVSNAAKFVADSAVETEKKEEE